MASAVSGGASQASRQQLIWSRLRLSITNLDLIEYYEVRSTDYCCCCCYFIARIKSYSDEAQMDCRHRQSICKYSVYK